MTAMMRASVAGAFVALAIVGGFLALDKTTVHWYAESNEEEASAGLPTTASFTAAQVEALTENAIADGSFKVPQTTRFAKCVQAEYLSGNDKWIVACEFRANPGDAPLETRDFVFDDAAGQVKATSSN